MLLNEYFISDLFMVGLYYPMKTLGLQLTTPPSVDKG